MNISTHKAKQSHFNEFKKHSRQITKGLKIEDFGADQIEIEGPIYSFLMQKRDEHCDDRDGDCDFSSIARSLAFMFEPIYCADQRWRESGSSSDADVPSVLRYVMFTAF
ncbi:hypothetical protein LOK49_LG08G00900 [Camellia lanceoleosa]|uniref:Uncharacterized protein n=1 Tax=Camellia lanceoleosa TaxID=1840588 RepID=A0ACC0GQ22_9ERIC|nr:hypothetical protein LOK49_LG08G00900 [Camellia lanceoleosa]